MNDIDNDYNENDFPTQMSEEDAVYFGIMSRISYMFDGDVNENSEKPNSSNTLLERYTDGRINVDITFEGEYMFNYSHVDEFYHELFFQRLEKDQRIQLLNDLILFSEVKIISMERDLFAETMLLKNLITLENVEEKIKEKKGLIAILEINIQRLNLEINIFNGELKLLNKNIDIPYNEKAKEKLTGKRKPLNHKEKFYLIIKYGFETKGDFRTYSKEKQKLILSSILNCDVRTSQGLLNGEGKYILSSEEVKNIEFYLTELK